MKASDYGRKKNYQSRCKIVADDLAFSFSRGIMSRIMRYEINIKSFRNGVALIEQWNETVALGEKGVQRKSEGSMRKDLLQLQFFIFMPFVGTPDWKANGKSRKKVKKIIIKQKRTTKTETYNFIKKFMSCFCANPGSTGARSIMEKFALLTRERIEIVSLPW